MISRVRFIRMGGEELSLSLTAITEGYSILDIDGLTPVPATLSSMPFAHRDGAQFMASRREPRDIKFAIGLEASPSTGTVRQLRNKLYQYLMPGDNIRMRFTASDGSASYDIWGRVETFEAPIFVQDAVANISIRCFDPDFAATGWTNRALNSTTGSSPNVVNYQGTVPTGFVLSGPIPRALSEIRFVVQHPDVGVQSMVLSYAFEAGDHLTLTTTPGERSILLKRGGQNRSIIGSLSVSSKWWLLHPRDNSIQFRAAGTPAFALNLGYTAKYGGL